MEFCALNAFVTNTTKEQLDILYDLGFRRISIGVQDFSDSILKLINRPQTIQEVEILCNEARMTGFTSINFDIIFGLPTQNLNDIRFTMQKIRTLKPDRIAFYSYAHVPWIKPSQRAYSEADLPLGQDKRDLYQEGRGLLLKMGYKEIGLDHFALPNEELSIAQQSGSMHRNFMGYTASKSKAMIGLGVSSISDSWFGFAQNVKTENYWKKNIDPKIIFGKIVYSN